MDDSWGNKTGKVNQEKKSQKQHGKKPGEEGKLVQGQRASV